MINTLNLSIVGHTNVGKTSFLRAISRNASFGEVSDKPGTTRHVESMTLTLKNQQKIVFFDTPGLEDSIALYEYIQDLVQPKEKLDGIDKLSRFLASPEAEHRFEQEAKVIRQLLKSDAGLYIIDVREPVLAKYHDELAILAESNKPLLAVFNFTASENNQEEAWKVLLSRVGIHAIIRFDAVLPPVDGELRLYQSLSLLVEPAKELISNLLTELSDKQAQRQNTANQIVAEALVDVTAAYRLIKPDDKLAIEELQNQVREREYKAIKSLLKLYAFDERYETEYQVPLSEGRFDSDLFNAEALKQMGIQLSKGVVTGAITGAGIDLAVGGLTLGTATLIGAAIGGLSQTANHYGARLMSKFSGHKRLTVDDTIICFLSLRLQQLCASLCARSHANLQIVTLPSPEQTLWKKGKLPTILARTRSHPEWSILNKNHRTHDARRQNIIEELAKQLP
ncbi:GTPase/DUF3482 domain-containing protein [Zophobihabitans entericus]|uniref:GTPase/DUF3482 domain-containing protein n=1 Tax=Zophobihabitans entericus TaxID=1635327 RepID=A0A6G9IC27_9GAMM|nr:GTPase/DUF3482 domain-containing protein [Zophobihabitans entericus]QIQ21264.1 GTPase/DUF3482 domain-containing protein [Zophobihabitans entericus]